MNRKYLLFLFILLVVFPNSSFANNLEVVNTIGLNDFHNNKSSGSSVLPLESKWEVKVGLTYGQPLIVGNMTYLITDKGLIVINTDTGKKVSEMKVVNANMHGTPYIETISQDKLNIYIPLTKGIKKVVAVKSKDSVSLTSSWINNDDIITDNLMLINDFNKEINKKYVIAASKNSKVYVLDSATGNVVTNGVINYAGTLGMSIPYGDYSSVLISGDNDIYDRGYFASITVVNGVVQRSYLHNEDMLFNIDVFGLSDVISYAKFKDIFTNKVREMVFAIERHGNIIAYDPFNDEVLFKINKYDGLGDVSGIAVVDRYLLISYKSGKVICVDYERSIYDAQYHPERITEAIVFETSLSKDTFSNPLVIKDSSGNNVLITADKNGIVKAYRLDIYDANNKSPIEVEGAFKIEGKARTYIDMKRAITSKTTYGNNQLLFVDDSGTLHSYGGRVANDLVLVDFVNNIDGYLEKGKSYKANLTILNSTNKLIKDVMLELIVDNKHYYKNKINVPAEGLTIDLEYTVPLDFEGDVLNLTSKINMDGRIIEEINYENNVSELALNVDGNVDLLVTDVNYNVYPVGRWAYASVKVKNNSNKAVQNVPISVNIEGNIKIEKRNIGPNMEVEVLYLFKTPSSVKNFSITGEVNHNKVYREKNYDNNKLKISSKSSSGVLLSDSSVVYSNGRVTWSETRIDNSGKSFVKNFWAELKVNAETMPNSIPSGNGFGLIVNSVVTTNYDRPNLITGAQFGYADFLGRNYETIGGGIDKEQAFMLKENPDSILYDSIETRHLTRKIYTPVELKDGIYDVNIVVGDVITPGGILRKEIKVPIRIEKSMYDYDYTRP